jgi:hypothetical protein
MKIAHEFLVQLVNALNKDEYGTLDQFIALSIRVCEAVSLQDCSGEILTGMESSSQFAETLFEATSTEPRQTASGELICRMPCSMNCSA